MEGTIPFLEHGIDLMDKRTVIALGIIALIFVFLPYYWEYIGFNQPDPDAGGTTDSLTVDTSAATRPSSEPEPAETQGGAPGREAFFDSTGATAVIDTLPEQFVRIETDLFTARISTRGASLTSYELKNYSYFNKGVSLIEMIPERSVYPLEFQFPEAGRLSSDEISFQVSGGDVNVSGTGPDSATVTLTGVTPEGAAVAVDYTFRKKSYLVGIGIRAARDGELSRVTRMNILWRGGLDPSESNRSDDYGYFKGYVNQGGEVATFDDFDDGRLKEGSSGSVKWAATKSKYFLAALIRTDELAEDFEITATEKKLVEKGQEVAKREFTIQLGNRLEATTTPHFELYLGPIDYSILGSIGYELDRTVELGFKLFQPFARAILWFVKTLHSIIPSYGWVIIVFTFVMKFVFFPFSRKNYQQMARMKSLQPKLKEIQEKYKEQPQELNKRMLRLYKEEKFNPLGGCIWMLPQLPIFWALFTVFKSAIDLRGAHFLWLEDLSQPSLALAVIMAAAMLVQQLLTNKDPKQKFMVYGMPVLMFFLFKGFPAGLVLYWTVYNLLSIIEQKSVERGLVAAAAASDAPGSDLPSKTARK
jgi:YidC/Oxa1 family membrane protein insertase